MSTFTKEQQEKYRQQFIEECHMKAWSAACHAEWVVDQMDQVVKGYEKMEGELKKIDDEITDLTNAIDHHTKDNREKRKNLETHRQMILPALEHMKKRLQDGYKGTEGLYQGIEANLGVAEFAKKWEWKEVEAKPAAEKVEDKDKK